MGGHNLFSALVRVVGRVRFRNITSPHSNFVILMLTSAKRCWLSADKVKKNLLEKVKKNKSQIILTKLKN